MCTRHSSLPLLQIGMPWYKATCTCTCRLVHGKMYPKQEYNNTWMGYTCAWMTMPHTCMWNGMQIEVLGRNVFWLKALKKPEHQWQCMCATLIQQNHTEKHHTGTKAVQSQFNSCQKQPLNVTNHDCIRLTVCHWVSWTKIHLKSSISLNKWSRCQRLIFCSTAGHFTVIFLSQSIVHNSIL